jgi:antitoxin Phd_YefM of type II toxin-antitoxin system
VVELHGETGERMIRGRDCAVLACTGWQEKIMRAVGAFEARNKLGQLLDEVEHGEEIVITRRFAQG